MNRACLLATCVLGLTTLALTPRSAEADDSAVVVLAATSLTESLQTVATAWRAHGHPEVTFSFDASSRLAKQVEAGAPADAFFSADREWMDFLEGKGLIEERTRANLLGNTLVAVIPSGSALGISSAADLGNPALTHVALAGDHVPAGKYARSALGGLGVWDAVKEHVVSGDNVRTVLGWVATGEAEVGVVYGTDARVEPRVKVAFTFPSSTYPAIVYPVAVLRHAAHAKEAAEFLAYCESSEGLAVFTAAGFIPPPGTK